MLLGLYKGMWDHYRTGVQKSSALLLANQRLGRGNRIALYMYIGHKQRKAKICLSWCLIKVLNDDIGKKIAFRGLYRQIYYWSGKLKLAPK